MEGITLEVLLTVSRGCLVQNSRSSQTTLVSEINSLRTLCSEYCWVKMDYAYVLYVECIGFLWSSLLNE